MHLGLLLAKGNRPGARAFGIHPTSQRPELRTQHTCWYAGLHGPGGQFAPADGVMVWPVPTDAAASINAAGLEALPTEGFAVHIHPHLDFYKDGKHVIVPALIGLDPNGAFIIIDNEGIEDRIATLGTKLRGEAPMAGTWAQAPRAGGGCKWGGDRVGFHQPMQPALRLCGGE